MRTPNSTYLDYTSYGTTTATVTAASFLDPNPLPINVAFILPRANDPTALLTSDWGTRQRTLAQLNSNGTLWSTYGASQTAYDNLASYLSQQGAILLGDATGSDGYVSSAASRTVWANLTALQFNAVFATPLLQSTANGVQYWNNSLTLPTGVAGVWFDTAPWFGPTPASDNLAGSTSITPAQGAFSIGNALALARREANHFSGDIAQWYYHFPLAGIDAPTTTVGLLEPLVGDSVPPGFSFQIGYDAFRAAAGLSTPGPYYVVANGGENASGDIGERSLDVGVVSSANPNSTLGLYVGSGDSALPTNRANSNVFTAYQDAFFDTVHAPPVLSSSFSILPQSAPGSPFSFAVQQLFIDAALANMTVVVANNDWGSSWNVPNGLANQAINVSSPHILLVGGTSLTSLSFASLDPTIAAMPKLSESLLGRAMAGDLSTLWLLIEGGLTRLPSDVSPELAAATTFLEAVWNTYTLDGSVLSPGLMQAGSSDGGVDTTQPTPWYQSAFGLAPTSVDPAGGPRSGTGRGAPDVAANAGGNLFYITPTETLDGSLS